MAELSLTDSTPRLTSSRRLSSSTYSTSVFSWNRKRESEILIKKIDTRMVELEKDGAEVINNLRKLSSWVTEMLEAVRINVNTLKTKEDPKNTYQEVSQVLLEAEDNISMLAASIARWKISEMDSGENDVTNNIDESGKYLVTELVSNRHEVVEEVVKESVGSMSGKMDLSLTKLNNETASVKIMKNQLKNSESVTPKTGDENNLTDGSVVLVSNLDTDFMDCDRLFNLISQYGPVKRIQFLKSALVEAQFQNAVVEMDNTATAKRVIDFLGKTLKVEPSSKLNVTDSMFSLSKGSKSFDEFRQKDKQYFYPVSIYYPPSRTLHFYRTPKLTDEEFYEVFDRLGAPVPYKVMWFPNKTGKGLLQFSSEDEALKAICIVNQAKTSGGRINLAFTYGRRDFQFYSKNSGGRNDGGGFGGGRNDGGSLWGVSRNTKGYVVQLRGLPYGVTEREIADWLAEAAEPTDVIIIMDSRGWPSGDAEASFNSRKDAMKVVQQMHRRDMSHRYVECYFDDAD